MSLLVRIHAADALLTVNSSSYFGSTESIFFRRRLTVVLLSGLLPLFCTFVYLSCVLGRKAAFKKAKQKPDLCY